MAIPDVTALHDEITAARGCGFIHLKVGARKPGDSARTAADAVATGTLGRHKGIGDGWVSLSRDDAEKVVTALLERDLAYGGPILETEPAKALATRVVALVAKNAEFFTNGSLSRHHAGLGGEGPWVTVTGSNFDTGFVAVSPEQTVVFWVSDED